MESAPQSWRPRVVCIEFVQPRNVVRRPVAAKRERFRARDDMLEQTDLPSSSVTWIIEIGGQVSFGRV